MKKKNSVYPKLRKVEMVGKYSGRKEYVIQQKCFLRWAPLCVGIGDYQKVETYSTYEKALKHLKEYAYENDF